MIPHLAKRNLRASPQDLMTLHRLEEEISERVNHRSDKREKAKPVHVLMPSNNRKDSSDQRVIPESKLNEYLEYLKYET